MAEASNGGHVGQQPVVERRRRQLNAVPAVAREETGNLLPDCLRGARMIDLR